MLNSQDHAGTESYSPLTEQPDGVIVYRTRSSQAAGPDAIGNDAPTVVIPKRPAPNVGGQGGAFNRLGWSNGFGFFRRRASAFTGRVLTAPPTRLHPAIGPVGLSTRSQRLRNGVEALQTDYTPSQSSVAAEIVSRF